MRFLFSEQLIFQKTYYITNFYIEGIQSMQVSLKLQKNGEGKREKKILEVDFIARKGTEKYYIQSALSMDDPEKQEAELKSLRAVKDSFKKIVISKLRRF